MNTVDAKKIIQISIEPEEILLETIMDALEYAADKLDSFNPSLGEIREWAEEEDS